MPSSPAGRPRRDCPEGALEPAHSAGLVMGWLRRGQPLTLLMDLLDGARVPSGEILRREGCPGKIRRLDDGTSARLLSWTPATRR